MSGEITFTTAAFGGFEKKQVLDYIYKMHEEMDAERVSHQKKLNEASISFKELEARAIHAEKMQNSIKKDLLSVQEQLALEKKLKDEFNIMNMELKIKLEQSERIIEQRKKQEEALKNELTSLLQINHNIQDQVVQDSSSFVQEANWRAAQNSLAVSEIDATTQLGTIMLEAHTKASSIIDDAKIEADKITNDAKFAIEQIRLGQQQQLDDYQTRAEAIANQMLAAANQQSLDNISKTYSFAKSMMNDIATATNTATTNFMSINEQVGKLVNSTNTLQQSARSDFIKMVTFPKVIIPAPQYNISVAARPTEPTEPPSGAFVSQPNSPPPMQVAEPPMAATAVQQASIIPPYIPPQELGISQPIPVSRYETSSQINPPAYDFGALFSQSPNPNTTTTTGPSYTEQQPYNQQIISSDEKNKNDTPLSSFPPFTVD